MYREKILNSENKYGKRARKSQLKPPVSVTLGSQNSSNREEEVPVPALVSRVLQGGIYRPMLIPEDYR